MSQISEYPFASIAENSSSINFQSQPSKFFESNFKVGQMTEKREEFAVSLRKSKKKQVLDQRRLKLGTKNKYGYVESPLKLESIELIKLETYLKSLTGICDYNQLLQEINELLTTSLRLEPAETGTIFIEDSKENKSIEFLLENTEKNCYQTLKIITVVTCLREDHARFLCKQYQIQAKIAYLLISKLQTELEEKIIHGLLVILINCVELLPIEESVQNLMIDNNLFEKIAEFLNQNPEISMDTLEEIAQLFE